MGRRCARPAPAVPFLLIQPGRTVWTIMNAPDAMYREHFVRVLIWLTATTPIWIAGVAASPERRVLYWGLAAGIDLLGTWLAHPSLDDDSIPSI
jgi:low temperature requirement protein LtrA